MATSFHRDVKRHKINPRLYLYPGKGRACRHCSVFTYVHMAAAQYHQVLMVFPASLLFDDQRVIGKRLELRSEAGRGLTQVLSICD